MSLLAIMGCCALARAAETPAPLEEVTVTAQKVTENARDVPISISVVDGAQLRAQHIADLADLTRAVPNFSFSSNGNPGSSILQMRGISSAAGASPVAIYLDNVSITQRLTLPYRTARAQRARYSTSRGITRSARHSVRRQRRSRGAQVSQQSRRSHELRSIRFGGRFAGRSTAAPTIA